MEKINSEILVSSLFKVGFDKVDSVFYTFVLGELKVLNAPFKFEESEYSETFKKYVDYKDLIYKLKDGITLDTMVNNDNEHYFPLKRMLNSNIRLVEYLKTLDYKKIIIKKISFLGIENIYKFKELFSNKEKEIIYNIFGMDKMLKEKRNDQSKVYQEIYLQESHEIGLMTKGLKRFK